jgi:hypothetical protein
LVVVKFQPDFVPNSSRFLTTTIGLDGHKNALNTKNLPTVEAIFSRLIFIADNPLDYLSKRSTRKDDL